MKNIYYILLLTVFSCSSSGYDIPVGGDNVFIESPPHQIDVILELDENIDTLKSTYFLKYYNSNIEKSDTMYFESLENNINDQYSLFYIWIQDIDQGSIGPFTKILDTGVVFIESVTYDSIYEFRRYN